MDKNYLKNNNINKNYMLKKGKSQKLRYKDIKINEHQSVQNM